MNFTERTTAQIPQPQTSFCNRPKKIKYNTNCTTCRQARINVSLLYLKKNINSCMLYYVIYTGCQKVTE